MVDESSGTSIELIRTVYRRSARILLEAHAAAYSRLKCTPPDKQSVAIVMQRVSALRRDPTTGELDFGEPESFYREGVDLWQVPGIDYLLSKHFIAREQNGEIFVLSEGQLIFDADFDQLIDALRIIAIQ